jgi:hypothetical protein
MPHDLRVRRELGQRDRSADLERSSATWLMSMSAGGATMPRRILTTRSVPPPSIWLPGCSARALITSSSVRG